MVRGLERFRDAFAAHARQYALIGGTACDLLLAQVDLPFRATKDLDMVLMSEMLDTSFARTFWEFVRAGRYRVAESTDGTPKFYRFSAPQDADFPSMMELFSVGPERLPPAPGVSLTPIPFDGSVTSLSAILLDAMYYAFLKAGVRLVDGVRKSRRRRTAASNRLRAGCIRCHQLGPASKMYRADMSPSAWGCRIHDARLAHRGVGLGEPVRVPFDVDLPNSRGTGAATWLWPCPP